MQFLPLMLTCSNGVAGLGDQSVPGEVLLELEADDAKLRRRDVLVDRA